MQSSTAVLLFIIYYYTTTNFRTTKNKSEDVRPKRILNIITSTPVILNSFQSILSIFPGVDQSVKFEYTFTLYYDVGIICVIAICLFLV